MDWVEEKEAFLLHSGRGFETDSLRLRLHVQAVTGRSVSHCPVFCASLFWCFWCLTASNCPVQVLIDIFTLICSDGAFLSLPHFDWGLWSTWLTGPWILNVQDPLLRWITQTQMSSGWWAGSPPLPVLAPPFVTVTEPFRGTTLVTCPATFLFFCSLCPKCSCW